MMAYPYSSEGEPTGSEDGRYDQGIYYPEPHPAEWPAATRESIDVLKRTLQGKALAKQPGTILPHGKQFTVRSQSRPDEDYMVDPINLTCTCVDHQIHGHSCKHVIAVEIFLANGETPEEWERQERQTKKMIGDF